MAKADGFLNHTRQDPSKFPVEERLKNYREFEEPLSTDDLMDQSSRCMDCGIPFCHAYGCPVHNRVPEWIEHACYGRWQEALELLHSTDNFPEVTGRVCPAPCEAACTLGINQPAVTIRHIELQIIERGWGAGWIKPEIAQYRTGKSVAVIGSGPAGLAAAQQLARMGHEVTVFEKADRIGGLLRYGIPDYKLEKHIINRRLAQMRAEGVKFETKVNAGKDLSAKYLMNSFDAVLLAMGAEQPRDLDIPGRELANIHFAVPFLTQQNKLNAKDRVAKTKRISAEGKHVIVIGGGDTGADCIGTANRQGAASVTQFEILPQPPEERSIDDPWPTWPSLLRTSSSHEEGCERMWGIATEEFVGRDGHVEGLNCMRVEWSRDLTSMEEVYASKFTRRADMVLLAMGFVHVVAGPLVQDLGLELDDRGNLQTDSNQMTTRKGVFAAGDSADGASLVVKAIHSGRVAAEGIDKYLLK